MNRLPFLLASAILAGCATRPPTPPDCEGELVPINPHVALASPALPARPADPQRDTP
jgi:hypothetical protein